MQIQLTCPAKVGGMMTDQSTGFGSLVIHFAGDEFLRLKGIFSLIAENDTDLFVFIRNLFDSKPAAELIKSTSAKVLKEASNDALLVVPLLELSDVFNKARFEEAALFSRKCPLSFENVSKHVFGHEIVPSVLQKCDFVAFYEEGSIQLYFSVSKLSSVLKNLPNISLIRSV